MKEFLYWVVYRLADIHTLVLQLNNSMEPGFSDKELHFIVMGLVGMAIFLLVHPVVKFLCKNGMAILVSGLYALTLVVVLAFGIEIGQQVTSTGMMDFADIVFGVFGFFVAFALYLVGALIWKLLHRK